MEDDAQSVSSRSGSVESSGYSEYGDYSVVTIKQLDEGESTCKQCYVLRETSVHENRENLRLMTSNNTEHAVAVRTDMLQDTDDGLPNGDQTETMGNVDKRSAMRGVLTENVSTLPRDVQDTHVIEINENTTSQIAQPGVQICIECGHAQYGALPAQDTDVLYTDSQGRPSFIQNPHYIPSTRTLPTDFTKREKTNPSRSRASLNCLCHTVSLLLSAFAVFTTCVIYYNAQHVSIESSSGSSVLSPGSPSIHGHALALQGDENKKITGRFKLDQKEFSRTEQRVLRWIATTDTQNAIVASPSNSCLTVHDKGTYGVISLFTYSIMKDDTVEKLGHYLILHGYQPGELRYQRKLFAVPSPEYRHNPEVISSQLISFVEMEANGQICMSASNNKYISTSPLDNTVNIYKVQ